MANLDLCIRFTEDKYASKSEVMKELKTSLIDTFWNNIVNYRKEYFINPGVKNIDCSTELVLCLTNGLRNKESQLQMKLASYMLNVSSFNNTQLDYDKFERESYASILNYVGHAFGIEKSEASYRGMLRGEIKFTNLDEAILINYVKALNFIKSKYVNPINKDFVDELRAILDPNDREYRNSTDLSIASHSLINRMYTSAPAKLISTLMNNLFNFVNDSNLSPFIKASIVYYYIAMIKPFNKYSEETGMLLAKVILAQNGLDSMATLIPLECLFGKPIEQVAQLMNDNQKYNDLTYFTYFFMDVCKESLVLASDNLAIYKGRVMHEEFVSIEEEKPVIEEKIEEPIVEVTPKIQHIVEEKPISNEVVYEKENLAINSLPSQIDERQAARLETHLLELDPSLRKGEAHFYARHCTLGKSYTIQQFKKYNGCAYETARSGMDHLVELGYYRKDLLKNKHIYTPVSRN